MAQEYRVLGECPTGDAELTRGYRLVARYVIHAVGPVWKGGNDGELALLASCYRRRQRDYYDGLPSISTGIYGYPIELAANVAVTTVRNSIAAFSPIRDVIFCCCSPSDLAVFQQRLAEAR